MATFLTDLMKKGYTQDEIVAVIFESERERKCRRMQAIVTETVNAHHLKTIKQILAYEKIATWRRMKSFDRITADDNQWASRPLPLTPEQFTQNLWSEVNALKHAISMPRQKVSNLINAIEQGKVSDEEFAILKRLVEKRDREAAQVTVTPVDTVQHSSPYPLDSEPSSDVCVNLENNEGRMDPERDELESPSAGTGLETPGQQCPPNEGIWETGRTTASGILTAGVGSCQEGSISLPTESVDTRASEKTTRITADSTFLQQGHKSRSEENKQFDPGGKGEKAPPWNAAVTLLSFSAESWEASSLFSVCASCFVCALFPKLLIFPGDNYSAS